MSGWWCVRVSRQYRAVGPLHVTLSAMLEFLFKYPTRKGLLLIGAGSALLGGIIGWITFEDYVEADFDVLPED